MKHIYKICMGFTAIAVILLFSNASTGPGLAFNNGYTGAPFDAGFCGNCHMGGNFTPSLSIQLLDVSNNPVSNYFPGANYTVRLNLSSSTGVTTSTRYGFQVLSVASSSTLNTGTWSPATLDHQTVAINGRTYVEHSDRLGSGIIDIPWTAPLTAIPSVIFYGAGNVVDFSFDPTGDNATTSSLTVPVNPLSISWLYFRGKENNGKVLLEWGTTSEIDAGKFIVEKSSDGQAYEPLAEAEAQNSAEAEHHYSVTDNLPFVKNFYRVKYRDPAGDVTVFRTISVQVKTKSTLTTFVKENNLMILLNAQRSGTAIASLYGLDGRKLQVHQFTAAGGANSVALAKPVQPGLYILVLETAGKELFTEKILVPN